MKFKTVLMSQKHSLKIHWNFTLNQEQPSAYTFFLLNSNLSSYFFNLFGENTDYYTQEDTPKSN